MFYSGDFSSVTFYERLKAHNSSKLTRLKQKGEQRLSNRLELGMRGLGKEELDFGFLTKYCFEGIPDECASLRAAYWKLVLKYLPTSKKSWPAVLNEKRGLYDKYKRELIKEPEFIKKVRKSVVEKEEVRAHKKRGIRSATVQDHPLNVKETSEWQVYWRDVEIFDQINKDVFRTRSELALFSSTPPLVTDEKRIATLRGVQDIRKSPSTTTNSGLSASQSEQNDDTSSRRSASRSPITTKNRDQSEPQQKTLVEVVDMQEPTRHYDILSRILFIYAKLNPGLRYVQGMNEILAPLYYVFASDPVDFIHAEPDAFFCFTMVMEDQRDAFCKALDRTDTGMKGRIMRLNTLLKQKDPPLWQKLENNKVDPQFYSLRWIMLMLTQEFEMPEVLRLWDSCLADEKKDFLDYVCVSLMVRMRVALMNGDFTDNMRLLQNLPAVDINNVLKLAADLRDTEPTLNRILRDETPPAANNEAATAPIISITELQRAKNNLTNSMPNNDTSRKLTLTPTREANGKLIPNREKLGTKLTPNRGERGGARRCSAGTHHLNMLALKAAGDGRVDGDTADGGTHYTPRLRGERSDNRNARRMTTNEPNIDKKNIEFEIEAYRPTNPLDKGPLNSSQTLKGASDLDPVAQKAMNNLVAMAPDSAAVNSPNFLPKSNGTPIASFQSEENNTISNPLMKSTQNISDLFEATAKSMKNWWRTLQQEGPPIQRSPSSNSST